MNNEEGKREKTLVADLPMMYPSDLRRFEQEGGIWGKQFAQRRRQLTFAGVIAATSTVVGSAYVLRRHNTLFVLLSTFSGFTVLGFCIGMSLAPLWYENIANNKETSMMRRVWWAKECAKHWDYSQIDGDKWKAAYPHAKIPGKVE
ncbi:hypothetical protein AGDE_01679 [Angomonas deanei]|uniref:Uncharacterized protein n=1 Tax=Angomonas deanei TaxID=59799 RepID=S9VGG9_9TRYP|nr:hypothetical protein AGDE_02016 [Angomonas deanei]EPY42244.1 hypothetical protein AGDE_01679 [Angomonas deanei]CAD2221503.1 hypothetical protein, conserved [Angomonas deanei]CAD2221506.1 hypothetical protein, conserved [Angomonas deanei]|eukprot:EPY41907.1 hypothetical protein AGDE_02016 [Angomonas deanei]